MICLPPPFSGFSTRRLLLAGVSILTLLAVTDPAQSAQSAQGRSGATSPAAAAAAAAQGQQAAAQAATTRSQALLARALKSYKERGDTQALARAQALAGANQIIVNGALVTLGNGLYDAANNPSGGLKPHPDIVITPTGEIKVSERNAQSPMPVSNIPEGTPVWIGADGPTDKVTGGHHDVTVKQNQQKAILTWESFDIGKDTTLYFDQTQGGANAANWIALNRVMDPNAAPSKILGNIKADGQVYLINRNGIIFGGSSQVNVHTLVASSLNLSNAQFAAGIANPLSGYQNGDDHWGIPTFGDHGTERPDTGAVFTVDPDTGKINPHPYPGGYPEGHPRYEPTYYYYKDADDNYGSVTDKALVPSGAEIYYVSAPRIPSAQVAPIDVSGPPPGDVDVRAGALITTAKGGKAMLFAPHVTNAGLIKAPDGQVILAAGENVWLSAKTRDPSSQAIDTSARGLDVAVSAASPYLMSGAVLRYALGLDTSNYGQFYTDAKDIIIPMMFARAEAVGYRAVNSGVIETERGGIIMQGLNVVQNGTLYASTALNNREGSILLRAWGQGGVSYSDDGTTIWTQPGTLTIGSGSATLVMPDLTDTGTIEKTSLDARYKAGSITLRGKIIDIETKANLVTPSGKISVLASSDTRSDAGAGSSYKNPVKDGSRIYIGEDALLSVAGITDVLLAMESNVIKGEFRINELRDSPLYRESWLRGATVYLDKRERGSFADGPMAGVEWGGKTGEWAGSPLGDMSAWIGTGVTTLAELSATGGSILLKSGGDVITRAGSLLDVSGGSVTYAPGWINSSRLVRADGALIDIADATPDQLYIGLADGTVRVSTRWGTVESYSGKANSRGQGRWENGYVEGRNAGSIVIYNGAGLALEGDVAGSVVTSERQAVKGNVAKGGSFAIGGPGDDERGWLTSTLVITNTPVRLGDGFTSATALPDTFFDQGSSSSASGKSTWIDAAMLNESGMGTIDLYFFNSFELAEGVALDFAPRTKFNAIANAGYSATTTATVKGSIHSAGGSIVISGTSTTLGARARLDVAGQTVNDYAGGVRVTDPVVKGGSVTLGGGGGGSGGGISIEDGAVIDVSGGLWLSDRSGKPKTVMGDAGTVSLGNIANADLSHLDMRAFAAGSGGSLTFNVATGSDVQLGGNDPTDAAILYLPDNLYADRGFRSVTVIAEGDVRVPDGASVNQIPVSVALDGTDWAAFKTGDAITDIGTIRVLETPLRAKLKPTALSLQTASGKTITIGAGARLTTDIGGAIALGQESIRPDSITVNGVIDAPAGSLSLAAESITLGDEARLLARGVPVLYTDPATGMRQGVVLAGGSVALDATGTLNLAQEAVIDVSGASGIIDAPSGRSHAALTLASDGGIISMSGTGTVQGHLLARAGGADASGGRLVLQGPPGGAQDIGTLLSNFDPDNYYGYSGDGKWDGADAIGFDLRPVFMSWGIDDPGGPMVLTQELIDALSKVPVSILVSETVQGGGTALSPADFGWTDGALAVLKDNIGIDLHAMFAATNAPNMAFRPSSTAGGGFSSLSLDAGGGAIGLKNATIHVNGTLALAGMLRNEGGSSSLSADYIRLSATSGITPQAGGAGKLSLDASLIDIVQASIRGFATTELVAKDILLSGQEVKNSRSIASLDSDGHLILKAGAVYPGTAVTATIRAGDKITVEQNGKAGMALSAGGVLALSAPEIEQNGTLLAPFGSITLTSTDTMAGKVSLGAGSVTSVSGAGLVLPYGFLRNGEEWIAPDAADDEKTKQSVAMTAPPEKRVTLDAPLIEQAEGAVIDIRGGGDLYAWEHVPGPGGSHDILSMKGVYAILPSQAGAVTSSGERIWLAGGNGLAAGWYSLLPAHYALLPGAYAVQMVKGSEGTALAKTVGQNDGSALMPGRRGDAHTGAADQMASVWRVMNGAVVRSYSEYNEAGANRFFASDAFKLTQYRLTGQQVATPRLPVDGGSLVLKALGSLVLDGSLLSAAGDGGRGGMVDIAAAKIAVAGGGRDTSDLSGYLVLDAGRLSGFGAASLLLGGVRSGTAEGTAVEVVADSVIVRNGADSALAGPEIILTAKDAVVIADGSVLRAKGDIVSNDTLIMRPATKEVWSDNNTPGDLTDDYLKTPVRDYGALIRLSNGGAAGIVRTHVDTSTGGLATIGAGAVLDGGNALMIDATNSTTLAGSAQAVARDITLGGGRIGFGGGTEGLVFDADSLARFGAAENLTLRSHTSIDFHAGLNFGSTGLKSLTLDAAVLTGQTGETVVITGDAVTWKNSGGAQADPGLAGQTGLTIDANRLTLGGGNKALYGFSGVTLKGASAIVGDGTGRLDAGAAVVTLVAPVLTGINAANQSVTTSGALTVASPGTAPVGRDSGSLGSIWSLIGSSVAFGGRIDAIGGSVALTASHGGVTVADGALIDVGGMAKPFHDVAEYVDAGTIALTAVSGDVIVADGARLDLSAASGGGNAGALSAVASGSGSVVLGGTIDAHAAKGKGGKFTLDIANLSDFAGFSRRLADAGFSTARSFRIRSGDVILDGETKIEDFTLVADTGKVTVSGVVTAAKAYGGAISIIGGGGVAMTEGAVLRASSTTNLGGGRVTLDAGQDGTLSLAGGTIDVSGGEGGRVRLRTARDRVTGSVLNAVVTGASSKVLEGVKVYASPDGTVDSQWAAAVAEANSFMSNAAPINGIAVMAGIEITSAGDLTLNSDIDLSSMAGHEGGLTLRAAENLIVTGNISDGFSRADRKTGRLLDQVSWDIRLTAGADLDSLDPLAVKPVAALPAGKGSLIVGKRDADGVTTGYLVRTGTGDLSAMAGRDLELIDGDSVLYTAGRQAAAVADFDAADRWLVSGGDDDSGGDVQKREAALYGDKGGNLAIAVGGGVKTDVPSGKGQLFTEWLWRVGQTDAGGYFQDGRDGWGDSILGRQTSWWVEHRYFRYGVGALGGGNVSLKAGGDVKDLVVAMPTNAQVGGGRFEGDSPKTLWLRGGGAMEIDVGGAILGGQYYIGRGDADIHAGSLGEGRTLSVTLGSDRPTARYALAPVLALGDARMTVTASGDLTIQTVVDPLLVALPYDNWNLSFAEQEGIGYLSENEARSKNPASRRQARPGGMTDEAGLSLISVGGDVALGRQTAYLRRGWDDSQNGEYNSNYKNLTGYWVAATGGGANLFPTNTRIVALNGSIDGGVAELMAAGNEYYWGGVMNILPGANSGLQMLAAGNVITGTVVMGTNKPSSEKIIYATPFAPNGDRSSTTIQGLDQEANATDNFSVAYDNPVHLLQENDDQPSRIYALDGSVTDSRVYANEQLWVRAGRDVRNVTLRLRNLHATDVSWIDAGNDIISGTVAGYYTNFGTYLAGLIYDPRSTAVKTPLGEIIVQGPGSLLLTAGRDVYGQEYFIYSTGNRTYNERNEPRGPGNPDIKGLPSQGADIEIMAGLNGKRPDYDAFAAAYLDPARLASMPDYLKTIVGGNVLPLYLTDAYDDTREGKQTRFGLVSFVEAATGQTGLTPDQAWQEFQALPELARQGFLRRVYMQELRAAGRDQLDGGAAGGYGRGYAAINILFPGDGWSGNVQIGNAFFRTMSGGDIRVMTPGGGLQAAALGTTVPQEYGLVTLGYGHIDIFARNNVTVNRSRILTFGGGDEIIWSTLGDIDAGRGAKTARVPSAPEVRINADGVTAILEKADMSGSGIGTIEGFADVEPGDLDLIAPEGTVNAGDAGVRVSGNIAVAALHVMNADNFDVKGQVKGLSTTETAVPTLAVENDEGQHAASQAVREISRQAGARGGDMPSIISVEVIGYGGGDGAQGGQESQRRREEEQKKRREQRSDRQDPASAYQVLGAGDLSEEQIRMAVEDRQRARQP